MEDDGDDVVRRRWLVDVARWRPSPAQFHSAVALLPLHELPAITRFVRDDDRKRALVSRLLQYSLAHHVLGAPARQISIQRTTEGKPYLNKDMVLPCFNFNTSHQGDYVGIASESCCLIGLDIVSISKPQGEAVMEFIKNFSSCLTAHEWSCIIRAGTPDEMLREFYRYWCLKEAFVKAIGAGVGFGLHRLEFHHVQWNAIYIYIDGYKSTKWRFWLFKLDEMHLASIAKGHPTDAVNSYKSTFSSLVVQESKLRAAIESTEDAFTLLTMEQLIQSLN